MGFFPRLSGWPCCCWSCGCSPDGAAPTAVAPARTASGGASEAMPLLPAAAGCTLPRALRPAEITLLQRNGSAGRRSEAARVPARRVCGRLSRLNNVRQIPMARLVSGGAALLKAERTDTAAHLWVGIAATASSAQRRRMQACLLSLCTCRHLQLVKTIRLLAAMFGFNPTSIHAWRGRPAGTSRGRNDTTACARGSEAAGLPPCQRSLPCMISNRPLPKGAQVLQSGGLGAWTGPAVVAPQGGSGGRSGLRSPCL